jgi:hypothetical protein
MRNKLGTEDGRQSDRDDVKIGYGSPPHRTRFRPGVSGNPKGRPKWSEAGQLTGLLGKEIFRPIRIQENGNTTSMPALQIGLRRLVMLAAKGDSAAIMTMVKLAQFLEQGLAELRGKAPLMTNQEKIERITQIFEKARRRKQKREEAKPAKNISSRKPIA